MSNEALRCQQLSDREITRGSALRTLWAVLDAWRRGARRRAAVAAVVLAAVAVGVFGVLAPPERCPTTTEAGLRRAASEAVAWFARNQQADGTWLYLYDANAAASSPDYNVVRHMGVQLSLYQAAAAGIPGALEIADRGMAWTAERVVERDDWAAVTFRGRTPVGASALLVAGLAERRLVTGDDRHDRLLRRLGRFLVAQTEPSGAVLAAYDLSEREPLAGEYSPYFTGEAYWALARLRLQFPDGPWGAAADRIGAYIATRRDAAEGYWPPLPDHWAAYGLAETVAVEQRPDGRPLTEDELALARRQAGLFGAQVRWLSQQAGPWGEVVRGTRDLRGGGYGVIGEALTGLWRVANADSRLAGLRGPLADRAACIAGLAIRAQADPADARRFSEPARVRGAWLSDGETRMDDQQHALSALLRTVPIVAAGSHPDGGPLPSATPTAWLWAVALFGAVNPFRLVLGLPRADRSPGVTGLAALGGAGGAALAVTAAAGGSLLIGALGISDASMRIAAGVVAAVVGVAMLVRRAPPPTPALPGRWAVAVPVAVPMVANAGVITLAISAYTDRGAGVVGAALAISVVVLALLAAFIRADGVAGRVLCWAGRLTAAVLLLAAAQIVLDGLFDV